MGWVVDKSYMIIAFIIVLFNALLNYASPVVVSLMNDVGCEEDLSVFVLIEFFRFSCFIVFYYLVLRIFQAKGILRKFDLIGLLFFIYFIDSIFYLFTLFIIDNYRDYFGMWVFVVYQFHVLVWIWFLNRYFSGSFSPYKNMAIMLASFAVVDALNILVYNYFDGRAFLCGLIY
ncbi:hypothetical protein [Bacterioplanoides sp.]|uniref:hypothetical protein n=1 Tax=Bacterioplanoides sp. TaxID=2066072 RepID=UPI003B00B0D0